MEIKCKSCVACYIKRSRWVIANKLEPEYQELLKTQQQNENTIQKPGQKTRYRNSLYRQISEVTDKIERLTDKITWMQEYYELTEDDIDRVHPFHDKNCSILKQRDEDKIQTWKYYWLSDPRYPDELRYIGITTLSLKERLRYHWNDRHSNESKWGWFYELYKDNQYPFIGDFEMRFEGTRAEAEQIEQQLVLQALRDGHSLCNVQYIPGDQKKFVTHLKSLDNNTPQGFFEQLFQIIKKVIDN